MATKKAASIDAASCFRCRFGRLFARANGTRQSAVIDAIGGVPQRLTEFDTATQYLNLVGAARRSIGWLEMLVIIWNEVLVVTITEDRFKHVFALTH